MGKSIQWTQNFHEDEFTVSRGHPELVTPIPVQYRASMRKLVEHTLQPIRDRLGRSMRILSAYRSPELNEAVGGSRTSQHVRGEAADFTVTDLRLAMYDILEMIDRDELQHVGQVIYYPDQGFIHIALPSRKYATPTFCVHWPAQGLRYTQCLATREAFDDMVPPHIDPNT